MFSDTRWQHTQAVARGDGQPASDMGPWHCGETETWLLAEMVLSLEVLGNLLRIFHLTIISIKGPSWRLSCRKAGGLSTCRDVSLGEEAGPMVSRPRQHQPRADAKNIST